MARVDNSVEFQQLWGRDLGIGLASSNLFFLSASLVGVYMDTNISSAGNAIVVSVQVILVDVLVLLVEMLAGCLARVVWVGQGATVRPMLTGNDSDIGR